MEKKRKKERGDSDGVRGDGERRSSYLHFGLNKRIRGGSSEESEVKFTPTWEVSLPGAERLEGPP